MKNLLLSAAIGDISGEPYEFEGRTKDYDKVDLLLPGNTYTDDTVCTFACAEALLHSQDGMSMHENIAKSLYSRCRAKRDCFPITFADGPVGEEWGWTASRRKLPYPPFTPSEKR